MSVNEITTGVGLRHVRIALRDTDGTIEVLGSPAAGEAYSGHQVEGAVALTVTIPESQRLPASGDDRVYYSFLMPPTESPSGELRVSKTDVDIIALLTGTLEFGSPEVRKVGLGTDKQGEEPAIIMWGYRQSVDTEEGSATFGQACWQTYFLLNAKANIRPSTMEMGVVSEWVYSVVANDATVTELGVDFSLAIHGFEKAPIIFAISSGKLYLDAFEGAGAEAEFTLTKASYLINATSTLCVTVEGVAVAFTQAAGVVTITAGAPAANEKIMIEYEYED